MKKSILMLTALLVLGACSTTGNDNDSSGDTLSAEATAFLKLVGGEVSEDGKEAGSLTTDKDWAFSTDGKTLSYYDTDTEADYAFDVDSVVYDAEGGTADGDTKTGLYTATYSAGDVTYDVTYDEGADDGKEIDVAKATASNG